MLVHAVYFWLDPNLTTEQKAEFVERLHQLPSISSVRHGFTGRPAVTNRPVIDRTYSWALTLVFDDMTAHDAYQVDPVHQAFVQNCSSMWLRVLIYDSE
ncbi:MAG: Dabb family protein [Blastocatellia bacterium]